MNTAGCVFNQNTWQLLAAVDCMGSQLSESMTPSISYEQCDFCLCGAELHGPSHADKSADIVHVFWRCSSVHVRQQVGTSSSSRQDANRCRAGGWACASCTYDQPAAGQPVKARQPGLYTSYGTAPAGGSCPVAKQADDSPEGSFSAGVSARMADAPYTHVIQPRSAIQKGRSSQLFVSIFQILHGCLSGQEPAPQHTQTYSALSLRSLVQALAQTVQSTASMLYTRASTTYYTANAFVVTPVPYTSCMVPPPPPTPKPLLFRCKAKLRHLLQVTCWTLSLMSGPFLHMASTP